MSETIGSWLRTTPTNDALLCEDKKGYVGSNKCS